MIQNGQNTTCSKLKSGIDALFPLDMSVTQRTRATFSQPQPPLSVRNGVQVLSRSDETGLLRALSPAPIVECTHFELAGNPGRQIANQEAAFGDVTRVLHLLPLSECARNILHKHFVLDGRNPVEERHLPLQEGEVHATFDDL